MTRRRLSTLWRKPLARALRTIGKVQRKQTRAVAKSVVKLLHPPKRAPRGAGAWSAGVALGPAGMRRYQLLTPPGVAARERLPLLVMLHGCTQDADSFALATRMNRLAVKERFLVLYPEQDRSANLQGCWNWYDTDSRLAYREAATLLAMVDQVSRLHPVDAACVVVAGLSAGASMAALLASRDPARFKAVVMHSGIPPGAAHSPVSALRAMRGLAPPSTAGAQASWPPLLVIHGTADHVVAPSNGELAAQAWADAAGARRAPDRVVRRGQRRAMTVTDFKRAGRTVVTLCRVDGLGHAWSGGAAGQRFADPTGPDASRMVWAFATRQFDRAALASGSASDQPV